MNLQGRQQKIKLQDESIQVQINNKKYNIKYDDVIGLGMPKQRISSKNEYKSYFYYFLRKQSQDHKNRKCISSINLTKLKICSLDSENLKTLRLKILNWFHKFYNRNSKQDQNVDIYYRKALCFVNPHSGPGKARKLYEKYKDVLLANGIYIEKHETQIAPFLGEFLKNMSKTKILSYDFFLTISGDGTVYELFNGYYKRKDIDFKKNPLTIVQIPGGSGCLLFHNSSKLSNTPSNIEQSIYSIIHPQERRVYLKQISCKSFDDTIRRFYYFLYVAQGVIGDSCVKSEGLRCIGAARFLVYGVYNSLFPSWYQLKGYLALNNTKLPDISRPITLNKNIKKLEGKYSHFIGSAQPYININTLMNPNLIQQPKKIDFHSFDKKKGRIQFIKYMATYNKFNPEKPRGCYQTLTNSYRVVQNTQNRLVVVDGEDFTKFNIKEYQLDATDLYFITFCQLIFFQFKNFKIIKKNKFNKLKLNGTQKYSTIIN